jgi:hypothetical protein
MKLALARKLAEKARLVGIRVDVDPLAEENTPITFHWDGNEEFTTDDIDNAIQHLFWLIERDIKEE